MALYRLEASPVQRSKGQSATGGAAYRSATLIRDERTGETHDFRRKRGVVYSTILAPEHAPGWVYDRKELWNRAERAEKRWDAQPARQILLALPHELADEERIDLVRSFVQEMFVSRGMVADVALHRPDRHGDVRNEHAHILLTMRELDGGEFSAKKNRDWNQKELLKYWREEWRNYENRALEEAGFDARVDHRSLEAQGSLHMPTLHMGKDATALERAGITTRIGDENREIRARNEKIDALVNELAAVDAEIAQEREKAYESEAELEAVLTWEEQKAAAQSAFNSHIVEYYRHLILEPGKEPEPEVEIPSPSVAPKASTARDWEEQKREAQSAFFEARGTPSLPEHEKREQDGALSWEEQKAAARDVFNSPVVRAYEEDIREHGEIREYGLGDTWFTRTIAKVENLYYETRDRVTSAFRDTWEKYAGRSISPDQDKDSEPER